MSKYICIIVQNYYDIAPRARNEVRCLVENGYEVDVIALRMEHYPKSEYELDGAHIITIPVSKKRGGKLRYIWEYLFFFSLATLIVSRGMLLHSYDVVQVCNLPDFLIFSSFVPKLFGAKVIFDMFEIMPEFFISKYGVKEDHCIIKFLKWQERQCSKFADKVIVINDPIKDVLEARGFSSEKVTVVMNSASEQLFTNDNDLSARRSSKRFVLMFHGTLTNIYGLDIAIRAYAKIYQDLSDAEFWIIGKGPERENLIFLTQKLGLKDRVKFFDVVPQQEIPTWLMQCDVGVLATRRDQFLDLSFSTKLPEYILMKKPVIASRLATLQYYFSENALAFFEPESEADLAQRMTELYQDPQRRRNLVEQASIEYSRISWSVMSRRYLEVFESLLFIR